MRELTGFDLQPASLERALATPTEVGKQLGVQTAFGVEAPIRPLFAAVDATPDETLATYPDGSAAVALRKTDAGVSAFVGAPGLTSEVLRAVCRAAGVHLFTQQDCNVWANGPFVVLHAPAAGEYGFDTATDGPITDMLTGQTLGQGPKLTVPLRAGETRVLRR
jgi:hypothetical protein